METLLQQVRDKNFKPSNFTVYSIIEEDGYIMELQGMFGEIYSIDDFEYMILDLSEKERNAVLYHMSSMTERIQELRGVIEKEIQDDQLKSKARVYVNREKCFISIVKLKEFDLKERIVKTEIGDEQESPPPITD